MSSNIPFLDCGAYEVVCAARAPAKSKINSQADSSPEVM